MTSGTLPDVAQRERVRPKGAKARRRTSGWHAYLFIGPSLFGVVAFLLLPMVIVLVLSLFEWELLSAPEFVGLDNYRRLLADGEAWHSLLVSVLYVLLCIPLQTVLALAMAMLLNRPVKGVKLFRSLYVVPWMATPIVLGLIWNWIFDPRDGALNSALALVGITGPDWLSDPAWALPAVALVSVWQHTGYNMLFFLAGLQSIPKELHDAASTDGATPAQRFWRVTLPLLNPTMFFVTVTNLIGAFQVFDTVYAMTAGGPGRSTEVINFRIFETAFKQFDFGYASTLSMLLFVIILVVTLAQVRFFGKRTTYDLS
ncbi:multiple sugar transport system permease protein/sn-glycerol 3-phosphate transport system permease protein [Nonomuraea thailandensis]|uniref:Multiple sugar transport system permease protein/sn-glycerol 3-phosphate transport system permease protein n=1 Tax=Nonomuraea thailandensis TaxID=1188745 RepID=A0A9X2GHZ6_9ACTN|nr:sugar ABC transporter permease [Nonomuraea thailandensis]MCP2358002.1 multiple sugar transport system permease protein/sn-glycerol 3-phosphate transport system permease protein [Nonomuraea thailandensis]